MLCVIYQDFFTASGKRKRDELPSHYQAGGFVPQQDGAGDGTPDVFEIEVWLLCFHLLSKESTSFVMLVKSFRMLYYRVV